MKKNLIILLFFIAFAAFCNAQTVNPSSPSNGSTIDGVTTSLYWSTISGSSYYDYQCDTTPLFNSPALKSGARTYNYVTVSNLYYATTYYWRVRARSSVDTTVWSVVWSFHTYAGVPALSSPADASTIAGVTTSLYWQSIDGSNYYDYQFDTIATFNSPALASGSRSSNYATVSNLRYGTTYYWRVRARNSVDTTSWSPIRKFFTQNGQLSLSSPSSGSYVDGVTTSLYWQTIDGSTNYDYQCDVVPTFNSPALKSGSRTYNYVTVSNLYYATTYYWRARARNSNDTTAWSSVWTFTTRPDIVTLSTPSTGSAISGVSTSLYWQTIDGSNYYDYQCDTAPTFDSPELRTGSRSYNYVTVSNLRYGTTYYWRVRARDAVDTTQWSTIWNFSTILPQLSLSSPTSGSYVDGVTTSLYWQTIEGSTYYDYQCDVVPTFNSPALKSGSRTYNYVTVSNLYYGTTYYWRARARNSNDTTAWSSVWTFTTRPDIVTLSTPTTGSAISGVSTSLYWQTIDGSNYYDYQCDTVPTFDSPELRTGSRSYNYVTVSNLRYGTTYYWRVRARDAVDTTQWSTIWNFSTILPQLSLSSPTSGSYVDGVTTSLYWQTIEGSTYYDYQCDVVPTFNSPALKSGSRTYNYVTVSNLYYGTTYYWRARARNSNDTTAWTAYWTFTTRPDIVTLSTPTTGSTISGVSTSLYWQTIDGSNYYDYQCDTVPTFDSPELITGSRSYNYVTVSNLRYGTTYYWRVRARDAVDTTQWSTIWNFSTFLPELSLSSPTSGSYVDGVTTSLYWQTIEGSTYYDYQCDTVPTFNSPALKSGSRTYNYVTVSNLYYGTTYYWRARARNSNDTTAWTAYWTFTTRPDIVTLSSPTTGSVINGVSTSLYWQTIDGSNYYDYQCDTVPTFDSPALMSGSRTSNYATISNLRYGTRYYWRVRARDAVDTTQWSATWIFGTILPQFTLSSPTSGSYVDGVTTSLYWQTIEGSTYYDYQCDTVPTFNSPALKSGSRTYNYVTVSNLYYGTTYYWRARARNNYDTTAWATAWTFTTRPDIVTLSSPSNGATLGAVSASLYWVGIDGSNYYDYQCDTSMNFNSPALQTGSTSNNYRTISNLRYCATYYWRVRARDAVDTTQWSTIWSFNTTEYLSTAPTLISPANFSNQIPINGQLFVWSSVPDVTGYEMQLSTNVSFSTYQNYNETDTFHTVNGLQPQTTYYWRVRAFDSHGTSVWSETWSFVTETCEYYTDFSETACGSYEWDGITYYQTGDYTRNYTTALGCDSIVTLHLTIYQSITVDDQLTICQSELPYQYGDTVFEIGTQSNVFHFTRITAMGCDSIVMLHLTVVPTVTPSVTYSSANHTLTCNTPNVTYQWIDCADNEPIPGAVNSVFAPSASGSYAVQITNGVCGVSTSTCVSVEFTSIASFEGRDIRCMPNPVHETLTISGLRAGEKVSIYDAVGKTIYSAVTDTETQRIDASSLRAGLYLIVVEGTSGRHEMKVLKK